MDLSGTELAALEAGAVQFGLFFRLETISPLYLWLGIGKIAPGTNALDIAGKTYEGTGSLVSIPPFQQLMNAGTESIVFTLSGVSPDTMAVAASAEVQGVQCNIGFALMSEQWALLAPIRWPKTCFGDFVGVDDPAPPSDPEQPIVRQVTLTVSDIFASRRRARNSYYTNLDQQARSFGDKFCERVQLASPWLKAWPPPPSS